MSTPLNTQRVVNNVIRSRRTVYLEERAMVYVYRLRDVCMISQMKGQLRSSSGDPPAPRSAFGPDLRLSIQLEVRLTLTFLLSLALDRTARVQCVDANGGTRHLWRLSWGTDYAKLRSNAPSCEVDVRLLVRAGWSYEG